MLLGGVFLNPLKILGSVSRLKILHKLSEEDKYVSQIMEEVGLDGKTAKHHLNKLEDADVISSREEDRRKYYSLKKEIYLKISPPPNRHYEVQFYPLSEKN